MILLDARCPHDVHFECLRIVSGRYDLVYFVIPSHNTFQFLCWRFRPGKRMGSSYPITACKGPTSQHSSTQQYKLSFDNTCTSSPAPGSRRKSQSGNLWIRQWKRRSVTYLADSKVAPKLTFSALLASPLTCPTGYSCGPTYLDINVGWACCDQIQCVGNYNVCEDYGQDLCGNLGGDSCSSAYTSILSW